MPQQTGYIQKDPARRPHIYEWTSQYAYQFSIEAEAGTGYFICRQSKDITITFPSNPYDGDVVSIIDITKSNDLAAQANTQVIVHHPGAKVIYYGMIYNPENDVQLDYLNNYQQFFLYNAEINTWIGAYIRIDATLIEQVIQQTYGIIYYGVCTTTDNYATKTVDVDNSFVLAVGVHIRVVFAKENTTNDISIDVNEWGPKPVMVTQNEKAGPGCWKAGQAVDFVYDGHSWLMVDTNMGGGASGSSGDGLTEQQVNTLIKRYLENAGISGVSESKIRGFIREYLEENGAQAGISESECVQIIENYLNTHNIQGSVDEATVNRLIAQYIQNNGIGSGGGSGGGLTTSQVNDLIEQYYNSHAGQGKGITYCTSSTPANTVTKTASIADGSTFELKTGASVRVKFTEANTIKDPTLNVNSTGSKNIKVYGDTNADKDQWKAGEVIDFVYDGTNWIIVDGSRKTDILETLSSGDAIQNAVNLAIQNSVEVMIDNKTAQTIQALNAQVDAKIEQLEGSVASSIQTLQGDVNTTIEGFRSEVNTVKTNLSKDITDAITAMRGEIANEVANINAGINDTISTAFDASIDEKIQANFNGVVAQMINDAKTTLEGQINTATQTLSKRINDNTDALNLRITNLTNDLEQDLETEIGNLRNEINNIISTSFSETIDAKIDAAFTATIDAKIRSAFTDAEGTLNAAIAGYNQTINQRMTEIQTDLNGRVKTIEDAVDEALTNLNATINTIINETFDTKIDEKMESTFSTRVEQIVNAQFSATISNQVDAAIDDLKALLKKDIKDATDALDKKIKDFTDTIDDRIASHYNAHIANDLNTLKTQLQTEIQTKVDQLDASIDGKINTKFDATIDTLMENKFSSMIDTKIEQNFNSTIDTKMNAVKQEIYDDLNTRIDARIRIAIDGEITTLINTKLEEYVAPAIGATY